MISARHKSLHATETYTLCHSVPLDQRANFQFSRAIGIVRKQDLKLMSAPDDEFINNPLNECGVAREEKCCMGGSWTSDLGTTVNNLERHTQKQV